MSFYKKTPFLELLETPEQDLKLMTGKLKLAEVEAVELSEKLKEREIPKN